MIAAHSRDDFGVSGLQGRSDETLFDLVCKRNRA